jgi:hypothetical protein
MKHALTVMLLAATVVAAKPEQPPRIESFDASVIHYVHDLPLGPSLSVYVPVIRAIVTEPNGIETLAGVTITDPDSNVFQFDPTPSGSFELMLPALDAFGGGVYTFVATDISGKISKIAVDYVPEVTLGIPVLLSPTDGETETSLAPVFDWENVPGASAYTVHVSSISPVNVTLPTDFMAGLLAFLDPESAVINLGDEITTASEYRVPTGRLEPGTEYWWIVGAADSKLDVDQMVIGQASRFTTESVDVNADVLPPVFTVNPVVERITESSFTVSWQTDETSDSRVIYGTDPTALADSVVDPRLTRNHRMTVEALTSATGYYLSVASSDYTGNRVSYVLPRVVSTPGIPDIEPPIFIGLPTALQVRYSSVVLKWSTDELTTASVHLVSGEQDTIVFVDVPNAKHSVAVENLLSGISYTCSVTVYDLAGNGPVTETGRGFTTPVSRDKRGPRALKSPVVIPAEVDGLIYWTADELHTAHVVVSAGPGSRVVTEVFVDEPAVEQNVRFGGLNPGNHYKARVTLTDMVGNTWTSPPQPFRTLAAPDSIAPRFIRLPTLEYISDKRAVFVWNTDEPADTYVRVMLNGRTVAEASRGALVRKHRAVVTKLHGGREYEFEIQSTDAAGNVATFPEPLVPSRIVRMTGRGTTSFTTASVSDTQAPILTNSPNVTAVTASTLTIDWGTDETANSVVYFEPDTGAGSGRLSRLSSTAFVNNVEQSDFVTEHSVSVTSLESGIAYRWVVTSTDPSGNGETFSGTVATPTLAEEDLIPPKFTVSPQLIGSTDSRMTVKWYTDEPSNSTIQYRLDGSTEFGDVFTDPDLLTEHVVTLTNLNPSTKYELIMSSMDIVGNISPSTSLTGETDSSADIQAPVLSVPVVSIDAEQAVVRWYTDEPSDTWIDYGTSQTYGTVISRGAYSQSHEVVLTNLTRSTQYHFQFASVDAAGNIAENSASELAFTTLDEPDSTPPMRITELESSVGSAAVRLNWSPNNDSLDVSGYTIERSIDGGDFVYLVGPLKTLTYTDHSVRIGSQYEYRILVRDVSAQGNLSAPSDTVSVSPSLLDAPGAPAAMVFDTTADSQPLLEVSNAAANSRAITSYSFVVAVDTDLTQIVTTGTNVAEGDAVTSYRIPYDMQQGRIYYWAAKAIDAEGFAGPLGATASFVIDTTYRLTAVSLSSFAATGVGRSVIVTWETASSEPVAFDLWRATGANSGSFERISNDAIVGGPEYKYVDPSVRAGVTYRYRLEAVLPSGETQTFGPVHVTAALPTRVGLSQNAPNPFNPSTSMGYQLPEMAHVRLVIYNALGQRTRVLVDTEQSTGFYRLTWDGLTKTGAEAASGLYFARLVVKSTSGRPTEIRNIRMTMLR